MILNTVSFLLLLFGSSLASNKWLEGGDLKLKKLGSNCVKEIISEYPQVTAQDIANWHSMEYPQDITDDSTMPSRCMAHCMLVNAKFYDVETSTFNSERFHQVFDEVPLDHIKECANSANDVTELCDKGFVPFNCILKKYRKEMMRKLYGTDDNFNNSEQIKKEYAVRAQEILDNMRG